MHLKHLKKGISQRQEAYLAQAHVCVWHGAIYRTDADTSEHHQIYHHHHHHHHHHGNIIHDPPNPPHCLGLLPG